MNDNTQTPYAAPSADLVEQKDPNKIKQFERFSAWGVFGLGIITLGIYPVYWLCTRAQKINSIHENKISKIWINILIFSTILYYVASILIEFISTNSSLLITVSVIILVVAISYLVSYIVVAFSIKNRVREITNNKSNGILTFFFGAIYLQYKINQAIDQSGSN